VTRDIRAAEDSGETIRTERLIDLWPVFVWMFLFMMSNGFGITVMPVRAAAAHMAHSVLGVIGSIYFAGMFIGYFVGPHLVTRLGYRLAGTLMIVVMVPGLLVLFSDQTVLWMGGRFFAGLGIGVSYVIAESWVAGRAHFSIRMTALSIYVSATMLGMMAAQALLTVIDPVSTAALVFGLAVILLATLLMAVAPTPPVTAVKKTDGTPAWIVVMREAPLPMMGVCISGFLFSIFITFYPAYGLDRKMMSEDVPLLGAVVLAGSTLVQPALGRLVELMSPLPVLIILMAISALAAAGLVFTHDVGPALYGLIALWGVTALTTYPLFGGLAYKSLPHHSVFDVALAILVAYGLAEIVAPPVIGLLIDAFGVGALFTASSLAGAILGVSMLATVARMR